MLRDIVADPARPPRSRQRALRALGELAGRDDIAGVTAIAAGDPLLFGAAAITCLRAMHRRGLFPRGEEAVPIVELALADHSISATETATIVFTCRHEAFRALVTEDTDEASWPRRVALLVGLAQQGSDDLPVGDALTAALPTTAHPEPFLTAIRALGHHAAEAAVLDALPRAPEAALSALEAIGGPRTVAALRQELGLTPPTDDSPAAAPHTGPGPVPLSGDPRTVAPHSGTSEADRPAAGAPWVGAPPAGAPGAGLVAPYLRPVRHRALALLWHLTDDPGERHAILQRLNPRDLSPDVRADLGAADPRELAVLNADIDPDDPEQALLRLARTGDPAVLPSITDLLLRIVGDLAGTADAAPADDRPTSEPVVPDAVATAIHTLGARLHERRKLRPFCLRAAGRADEAGHALVATIALDLIDRTDLSSAEQAILLGLLRQAPYPGTRARVHRLLRHHDRHVRKQVIALIAADAEVLSASLIVLTTAGDPQTVRQALLALGQVRAHWAAPAIAACLENPSMNVKKTAATALVRAGTPAVVPRLLFWLGHHDNPGLRADLVAALRAILGAAYAATVLAAAEQAGDNRTRELLLDGLSRELSARAVDALAHQESPIAPVLLAQIAAGRIELGSGTIEDLTATLAAHGLAAPASSNHPAGADPLDSDIDALTLDGWNPAIAQQIVNRHDQQDRRDRRDHQDRHDRRDRPAEQVGTDRLDRLRPMLADWLALADAVPGSRSATLRFILRLCPAPWSADELATFSRAAHTLVSGLSDTTGQDRDDLIEVFEAVAAHLSPAQRLGLTSRVRALAPAAGRRSSLVLLRRYGAVLTRADVEHAIAEARLGPDPWLAETALLRDAFAATRTSGSAPDPDPGAAAWRQALEAAVRGTDTLDEFRRADDGTVSSRQRLDTLIDVFPAAAQDARAAMLDWMEALQPIDTPPWTLTEDAHRPVPTARTPYDGDLDQPRSAAQRDRLLALLDAPTRNQRDAAAATLRDWPEPETTRTVLRAFLHGRVDLAITPALARALTTLDEAELRSGGDAVHERAARVARHLAPADRHHLIPLLLDWWEHGGPATRTSAEHVLRASPDLTAASLRGRLDAGAWGFLDLIAGQPLLRTPELSDTDRRLRAAGRDDLADRLLLVDGPLRDPDAADRDAAALAALRERRQPPTGPATRRPARPELITMIRTGHPEQIRRALTQLAGAGPGTGQDPEITDLLAALLHHPHARVRLHAHRLGRRLLSRPTYLSHTMILLDDPEPAVVRSAISTLSHAAHQPAIPAIVGLLAHQHTIVRRAATDALLRTGPPALGALTHAASHARPDRRHVYHTVLDRITEAEASDGHAAASQVQ
ncbi:HEAT repeat domain-containing protein [Actinoplanes palleronii]|uniref:HEAT repeat domain-containing protein n=1 Tax=Actinoplanes palleronii TaxID=113570 RepID=UPI0019427742|nr:HEAT repeat domain-containing protein [Actinoplanes palleronii]